MINLLMLATRGGMDWRTPKLDKIVESIMETKLIRMISSLLFNSNITWQSVVLSVISVCIAFILFKVAGSMFNFIVAPIKVLILVAIAVGVFFLVREVMS